MNGKTFPKPNGRFVKNREGDSLNASSLVIAPGIDHSYGRGGNARKKVPVNRTDNIASKRVAEAEVSLEAVRAKGIL